MISIKKQCCENRKAKIDFAGVAVAAGLNGTGKSTLAKQAFCTINFEKNMLQQIYNDPS